MKIVGNRCEGGKTLVRVIIMNMYRRGQERGVAVSVYNHHCAKHSGGSVML